MKIKKSELRKMILQESTRGFINTQLNNLYEKLEDAKERELVVPAEYRKMKKMLEELMKLFGKIVW